MSVTFHIKISDTEVVKFRIFDYETQQDYVYDSYADAQLGWITLGAEPQSWSLGSFYPGLSDEFDVNLANSNAREILGLLDLDSEELCGSLDSQELLARCLVARAFCQDNEISAKVSKGDKGATIVDMGRRESYLSDKLGAIEELASRNPNQIIVWS